jgi:hypothetical protein
LDTGSTRTIFDKSLPLGAPRDAIRIETLQGEVLARPHVYDAPEAKIGRLPLRVASVLGMDLSRLREVSGLPIEGILGMDFLWDHVVYINFDKGDLAFLRSAPVSRSEAQAVPITRNIQWIPQMNARIGEGGTVCFVIDTGCGGQGSGNMVHSEMEDLVERGVFRKVGSTLIETVAGTSVCDKYMAGRLLISDFAVKNPVFGAHNLPNTLGLGFWSRFEVVFDFPDETVYLVPGEQYSRPDRWYSSGIHLLWKNNRVIIDSVDMGSPGHAAGVRAGDVLLRLGDLPAGDGSNLESLREALGGDGTLTCLVRRGDKQIRLSIVLGKSASRDNSPTSTQTSAPTGEMPGRLR